MYKVGDKFEHRYLKDALDIEIIFVTPPDGYGEKYYVIKILNQLYDGKEKHFYNFIDENVLTNNLMLIEERDEYITWQSDCSYDYLKIN